MLDRIESKMALHIPVDERPGRNHLGVEKSFGANRAMEGAAMPVRPVHHRCDAECVVVDFKGFLF
jgi:hypothetical protein